MGWKNQPGVAAIGRQNDRKNRDIIRGRITRLDIKVEALENLIEDLIVEVEKLKCAD